MILATSEGERPVLAALARGERLEGLAFSIMAILDGVSSLPAFIVAPLPHPDDKEFHRDEGEHWWPENHTVAVVCDISGGLHELLQGGE